MVVFPSVEPVTIAVFSPSSFLIILLRLSYKYFAVSANAVKIKTFLLPSFIGCLILLRTTSNKVWSFLSFSGVMADTSNNKCSKISLSVFKSTLHAR